MKLFLILLLTLFSTNSFSHSGGVDSNGCHAGSQPYHCHSGSSGSSGGAVSSTAWDINAGYQYHITNSKLIPFIGASIGRSKTEKDTDFGGNLGLKLQNGWYASYVTTSESIQLGYKFVHLSANSEHIGFGFRWPISNSSDNQSSAYYSGSILFSDDEE